MKDEAQRLARRAAGGDVQAARRLVALLERSAKAPSLETEERAAWATFSTRRLELVRRAGAWTLLCPVCGNDDIDEFGYVELVTHTRGVAGASKGLLAFDGTSDWGHDGQLSGAFCKRCDSLFDVPKGIEVDFSGFDPSEDGDA